MPPRFTIKQFRSIHKKTHVLKSLLNKVADGKTATSFKKDSDADVLL